MYYFTCEWEICDVIFIGCLVGIIDDNEFEFVPSEKNAESEEGVVVVVIVGWLRVIVTGDFDKDECELLGLRRGILLLGGNRE